MLPDTSVTYVPDCTETTFMSPWSRWKALDVASGHRGPAVYQIRLARGRTAVVLRRLLESDPEGLLAIGETSALENRRRQFLRGLTTGAGHSEANLIWILSRETPTKKLFRNAVVEYRFCHAGTKAEAVQLERDEVWQYARRFGEVPPFNSSFPGRESRIEAKRREVRRGAS